MFFFLIFPYSIQMVKFTKIWNVNQLRFGHQVKPLECSTPQVFLRIGFISYKHGLLCNGEEYSTYHSAKILLQEQSKFVAANL